METHTNRTIFLIADPAAADRIASDGLPLKRLANIAARVLTVPPSMERAWSAVVKQTFGIVRSLHTFGTYYRLFMHEVLPTSVRHAIYFDTDVVVLASLWDIYRERDGRSMFQIGALGGGCAGILLFDVVRMRDFWPTIAREMEEAAQYNNTKDANPKQWVKSADQSILRIMKARGHGGNLTDAWDTHLADGAWRFQDHLAANRPRVGALHFNGGGASSKAYLNDSWIKHPGWKLAQYYQDVPWAWVDFMVSAK
eukprot:g7087.t1